MVAVNEASTSVSSSTDERQRGLENAQLRTDTPPTSSRSLLPAAWLDSPRTRVRAHACLYVQLKDEFQLKIIYESDDDSTLFSADVMAGIKGEERYCVARGQSLP